MGDAHQAADTSLLLLPTAPGVLEGAPLEEVLLVRDEVANMVWGIETTVPSPTGEGTPGREAARDTRRFFERDLARRLGAPPAPLPAAESARIRYQVMTSVPEHWIPFVPVHVPGDVREIQLQRAAMLRILEGAPPSEPPARVEPRSALLREGREGAPPVRLLCARRGGAARRRARHAALSAHALARRPRLGVAGAHKRDRPRREFQQISPSTSRAPSPPRRRSAPGGFPLPQRRVRVRGSNVRERTGRNPHRPVGGDPKTSVE